MHTFQRLLTFVFRSIPVIGAAVTVFSAAGIAQQVIPENPSPQGILADRLIVQVNATSYTQWQLESHWLVKESLRLAMDPTGTALGDPDLVSASNWAAAVDAFVVEMLILQEAKRIGSFMPTARMADQGCDMVRAGERKSVALGAAIRRMGITDAGLRRIVSDVIRVDAFAQSQDRGAKSTRAEAGVPLTDRPWIVGLRERAIIRRYEAAQRWREITPIGGRP